MIVFKIITILLIGIFLLEVGTPNEMYTMDALNRIQKYIKVNLKKWGDSSDR